MTRRSLLEVEAYFTETDTPATYRFQPALRQELRRQAGADGGLPPGALAYGIWLARWAYGTISRESGLAQLVSQSLPLLEVATSALRGEAQLWHIRRMAWLRCQFGELLTARQTLEVALPDAPEQSQVRSALLFEYQEACERN